MEKYAELRDAEGLVRITLSKKPVLRDVDLSKIVINIARNRRDEAEVYEKTFPAMMDLMDSLRVQEIIPGYYPVIHDEGDGTFDALIGHRRLTACNHLGWKTVPCIVTSGLTEEEKLMVIFGSKEEHEGAIGEFKEVKALIAIGLSRKAIAEKLNWKTSKQRKLDTNAVQFYAELISLPVEVQEEWKQQQRKTPSVPLTMPTLSTPVVRELYKAMGKDVALFKETKGLEGSMTGEGLELRSEIAKLKTVGKTSKAEKETRKVSISTLEGFANSVTNNIFKNWLFGISGTPGINFGPLLAKIDDAMNLVHPNPKPETAPATVEGIFKDSPNPSEPEPEPEPEPEVIREGTKSNPSRRKEAVPAKNGKSKKS